jgi:flagellar basal-body rod modification protein FlgD
MTTVSNTRSAADIYASLNGSATTQSATEAAADRFLKLLVAQMQNQDPLSPMDNAQVTSQMAQINTVSGIEKVNESIQGMSAQFGQLQALQGASLVGRGVLVGGNQLQMEDGVGRAAFELDGSADAVKLEVLNSAGRVVDTVQLGAEGAGRHNFDWTPPAGVDPAANYTFRLSATRGAAAVTSAPLMRDQVVAVSTSGGSMNLELASGAILPYSVITAFTD